MDDAAAQNVVQDTIITVAKEMPGFRYDRAKGSFKGWLLLITKRRIADALCKRYRGGEGRRADPDDPAVAAALGVSLMQVYLARHRVDVLLRKQRERQGSREP